MLQAALCPVKVTKAAMRVQQALHITEWTEKKQ